MKRKISNKQRNKINKSRNDNKSFNKWKKVLYGDFGNGLQKEKLHCKDKRGYIDENIAVAIAMHREDLSKEKLYWYKCKECNYIHLTKVQTNTTRATY